MEQPSLTSNENRDGPRKRICERISNQFIICIIVSFVALASFEPDLYNPHPHVIAAVLNILPFPCIAISVCRKWDIFMDRNER